uniref:ELMO domain-containing protein n=1 Tax=Clastoptera arizonana TaxID=38151 RepID=A0A1B6DXP2_9HEMI
MISFNTVYTFIYLYIRQFIKWFLRKTTKLCELQRICYGEPVGCLRSRGVEYSLSLSRDVNIKEMIKFLNKVTDERRMYGATLKTALEKSIHIILLTKQINPGIHKQFIQSFGRCIEHIWGYRQLFEEVEFSRTTQYNADNPEHEEKLLKLWNLLMPKIKLSGRVSKQWRDIGFQGDDPKTDFRGMGILGLDNLIYFAEEYPEAVNHVLSHSMHPKYGYAFAIVGINLTSMAYHLFKDGTAKTHVYNVSKSLPSMRIFHQFYCYLFYEFDKFWIEAKPSNVMEFTYIRDKFESNIRTFFLNPHSQLN